MLVVQHDAEQHGADVVGFNCAGEGFVEDGGTALALFLGLQLAQGLIAQGDPKLGLWV